MKSPLQETLDQSAPLGQTVPYPKQYNSSLLFPVERSRQRVAMGFSEELPFFGMDIWNCYELSWLNTKGKPVRSSATITVPANSKYLAESKSVKLYLNSLNQHRFESDKEARETIERDISYVCEAKVVVELNPMCHRSIASLSDHYCLDELDIEITNYHHDPRLIVVGSEIIEDKICSHLFKSHCLCTSQPDWASIFIEYEGPALERASLLAYLVSFHEHVGFSETCVEQIYRDIMERASPRKLHVFGRFTRRGGVDINPYRQSYEQEVSHTRLIYQ